MIDLSPISRHKKIALSFSGGKDSLACVYLLRDHLGRITVYHMDTGDLLPEMMEIVEHVKSFAPSFVHLHGDVARWIEANGLPTDLMPYSQHKVGRLMGESQTRLVSRYDCCVSNLMNPIYCRIRDDGNTLLIRGTKSCDMKTLPAASGEEHDGMEIFYPLQGWSNADVFAYLRSVGAPICRVYEHVENSPECARCSAWWGEKRASYLRRHHPALWNDYRARMSLVFEAIRQPLENLTRELGDLQ